VSVLRFEQVSYRYPSAESEAIHSVSLAIEPGEFCVLAGMSGSGKSTVLRAAAGLVPHFHGGHFAGQVTVDGLDTREHPPADIGAVAGTVLQDPETQIVMSTVRAELALALENRASPPASVARAVEETALALGIAHLLDRPTGELSGGELQRVALAAALVSRPRLVLLDEPTSQLDPVAGDELIWQLRRLNQESDTAVLLVEHRLERCLAAADRVIAMDDGAIACDSDPQGFLRWAGEHEPALQTPGGRLFERLGLSPPPTGVKQARSALRRAGLIPPASELPTEEAEAQPRSGLLRRALAGARGGGERRGVEPALELKGVWHELRDGPAILRGAELRIQPGEKVVLMGRNGAGKSTLLRHAAGLLAPTRGRVTTTGRVALLLQNPGDYFLHERVEDEAEAAELERVGLAGLGARHPRDLSGGQRQRLALAIVLGGDDSPAVLALDEPTRGMDRAAKEQLVRRLEAFAAEGIAVLLATHDGELAAEIATRAVLLADGRVIADGPVAEILAGGWYFSTETARILDGAGGALLPGQGAELLLAARRDASKPRALAGEVGL
jgi:energy-coupling factor transport system ATP-binding protein